MNEVVDTENCTIKHTRRKNQSLAEAHPDILLQWHPTKNGILSPYKIGSGSEKKIWWKCPKGADHEWQAIIYDRTKKKGTGCPVCLNQKVVHSNCLMTTHPEFAMQWHPTKNGNLTPDNITSGSHKKCWWKCNKGSDHEWESNVYSRTKLGTSCPICSGFKTALSNCLATTHPDLAKQWHPTKNSKLSPYDVRNGSNKKVWWKCSIASDHEWQTQIINRTKQNGTNCPICSNRKVTLSNCLATSHPELAKQWHPTKNENLYPRDVTKGYTKKIWWKCKVGNDHEWEAKINDRTKANGTNCPICLNQKIVSSNCLATTHPELTKQWHLTRNGNLSPYNIVSGSGKSVWWKCDKGDDHEWQTKVSHRTALNGSNCPACKNLKVVPSNCLARTNPEIAKQWHPTKNGALTPHMITKGYDDKVTWKCDKGNDHEWVAKVSDRTKTDGTSCPVCRNLKVVQSNCLAFTHPEIAKQWHPTKNSDLTPYKVVSGGNQHVVWKCDKGDDHEWEAMIISRTKPNGTNCPVCSNQKIILSNCLATTHPELVKQWHPTKNGSKSPFTLGKGSNKTVWWKCSVASDHEWQAQIISRTKQNGTNCPICLNKKAVSSNCLAFTHPEIAAQWHPTNNGSFDPNKIVAGSNQKVYWKCDKGDDHEWEAMIISRTKPNGTNCPVCSNHKTVPSNCLATTHSNLAKQWHATKNSVTPFDVNSGSDDKVWWQCPEVEDHVWEASVRKRSRLDGTGCPFCKTGWTIENIRLFVKSLLPHIESLIPADLYTIFQQNGIAPTKMKGKSFLQALKTGKFPKEELEKFVDGKESLVDEFIADQTKNMECLEEIQSYSTISDDLLPSIEEEMPLIETEQILSFLDSRLISNVDQEAIEFLIASATAKIWNHAFADPESAIKQLDNHHSGLYAQQVKQTFREQYYGAKNLVIPNGYSFKIDGKLLQPNLMQLFTAYMLQKKKRLGNWSGTGAGKTLSAILASRVINSHITIICCPNSVTKGWSDKIKEIFPDSVIFNKALASSPISDKHNYFILNYEFFQQPGSERKLKVFIEYNKVDFVVIDEIHFSKQRKVEKMSARKKVITAMLSDVAAINGDLCVLGMSATPVINNLFEGKTLIELITGMHHDELNTKPTIPNCMSLHQKLVSNGIRWIPKYKITPNIQEIKIDCSGYIDEIKRHRTPVDLESILTQAKLPEILKNIKNKTVVYTHYIKNILTPLKDAIEGQGWSCAVFSGDDKSGLDEFLYGDTEVLIATSCLSTGVDGLQNVCSRIIINVLPWTHAEFEQLKGRIYRQGQIQNTIDIIVPLTYAIINGERKSWCEYKWRCIKFKKSIADAAVDGEIPEGHIRSPAQAFHDIMSWFKRLEEGRVVEIQRERITLSLSDKEKKAGFKKFGDFSKMNHRINAAASTTTHNKFKKNPDAWRYYHELYREARKDWATIPYQEAIKWCKKRPHIVIGDFGCGEAILATEIENQVHSFDHIAINEDVIACDMSNVPLDDESLDAAIFSLSLMGSNYIDYITEAHRCLKLDGYLWIAEATSRFQNLDMLEQHIINLGFDIVKIHEKSNFTFLRAIKNDKIT